MKPRVLIVDDDEATRTQIGWGLAREYDVFPAEDRVSAVVAFEAKHPAVVLLDLGLPPAPGGPEEGMALLSTLLAADSHAKVIIASGLSDRESVLRALERGAFDFLPKPLEMDRLRLVLRRAFRQTELEREHYETLRALNEHHWPDELRGLADRVNRTLARSESGHATAADVTQGSSNISSALTLKRAREAIERELILQALERNNFKISRAATELGVSRPTLYGLMEKLGIGKADSPVMHAWRSRALCSQQAGQ